MLGEGSRSSREVLLRSSLVVESRRSMQSLDQPQRPSAANREQMYRTDSHDSQGPDVDLWSVLLPSDDLWSHPVGRTNHSRPFRLGWVRDLSTKSEVGCKIKRSVEGQVESGLGHPIDSEATREGHMTQTRRTEFDVTHHTEKNVVTLDVSVDDAMTVKMPEPLTGLLRDGSDLSLGHNVASDDVGQAATFHVFHDDP